MNTWITSDWHLGDPRVALLKRPFKDEYHMYEVLLENHNSLVKPNDHVFFLGDVCWSGSPQSLSLVEKFNGRKTLIRGNHDRNIAIEEFYKYFDIVVEESGGWPFVVKNIQCWMTHYPTKSRSDMFNLVGHIHGAWKYQKNMFNVGIDCNHFRPHNADEIPNVLKSITEFYDDDVWVAGHPANVVHHSRGKKGSYLS